MTSSRSLLAAGAVLAATALAAGCGSSDAGGGGDDGTISVVTSTNVWGSVARAVGGADVKVTSLISDPSADPHSYADKPEDAVTVGDADLAVYNGGGYDDFFGKLAENAGQQHTIAAFDLSGKGEDHAEEPAEESGDEHGHEHGEVNEHVWYDLPTVRKVADKIAVELGTVAPDKQAAFAENAKSFGTKLTALEEQAKQIGQAHPGTSVVATEPVAGYLLETAGLTDATPPEFSEAIEEETDPSAAAVAQITELVEGKQVAAVVNNAQTETPVTKSLVETATGAGVPVVGVTETLPEGVTDYVEWMTKQIGDLTTALGS
jgi:zinc/manganese transport system substrate-binding protein